MFEDNIDIMFDDKVNIYDVIPIWVLLKIKQLRCDVLCICKTLLTKILFPFVVSKPQRNVIQALQFVKIAPASGVAVRLDNRIKDIVLILPPPT